MKRFIFIILLFFPLSIIFTWQTAIAKHPAIDLTATHLPALGTATSAFYQPWRPETPSPTPTFPPLQQTLPELEVISPDNVRRLEVVDRWGKGAFIESALSPDHTTIAVATTAGVYIYRSHDLEQVGFLDIRRAMPPSWLQMHIAFSSDGKILAVAGASVTFWDIATLEKLGELPIEQEGFRPWRLEFVFDREHILVWNYSQPCGPGTRVVTLYSLTGYKILSLNECDMEHISSPQIVEKGRWALFFSDHLPGTSLPDEVYVVDLPASKVVYTLPSTNDRRFYALSPDGRMAAYTISDGRTEIVDLQTGEFIAQASGKIVFEMNPVSGRVSWHVEGKPATSSPIAPLPKACGQASLASIPNSTDLLAQGHFLQLLDPFTCRIKREVLFYDQDLFDFNRHAWFDAFDKQMVWNGPYASYLFDSENGEISNIFRKSKDFNGSYFINENIIMRLNDSQFLLSEQRITPGDFYVDDSDYSGYNLQLIDRFNNYKKIPLPVSGRRLDRVLPGPDPQTIFVFDDRGIHFWDILARKELRFLRGASTASLTLDKKQLLFYAGGKIHILNIASWQDIAAFDVTDLPYIVEIGLPSSKGRVAVAYSFKSSNSRDVSSVAVFDIRTGKKVFVVNDDRDEKSRNAFRFLLPHPYFFYIAPGGIIEFWSPDQDEPLHTFIGSPEIRAGYPQIHYSQKIDEAVLSPDGRIFVTNNNGLQFWDIQAGRLLAQMPGKNDYDLSFSSVLFSPDGRYLVTVGSDGTFWVWGVRKK